MTGFWRHGPRLTAATLWRTFNFCLPPLVEERRSRVMYEAKKNGDGVILE